MRTSVTAREKERAERATLVQQEKLSKAKVGPPIHTGRPEQWVEAGKPVPSASVTCFHHTLAPHRWSHHSSPLAQGRVYALNDVWIRPPFGGKGRKMTGQLEAHANGFRYSSPKGEQLDIMYRHV